MRPRRRWPAAPAQWRAAPISSSVRGRARRRRPRPWWGATAPKSPAPLRSNAGTRTLGIAELLAGPGQTTAAPGELLETVEVPLPRKGTGSCYVRLEYRRQMEIAVVGATAVVTLEDGRVSDARVAITALAPTIRRVPDAEAALIGTDVGNDALDSAARALAQASRPISDVRASAGYRSAMAAVIGRRAIEGALARARGEHIPVPASPALHGGMT